MRITEACHQYGALAIPQLHYGGLGTHPQCGKLTSPTAIKWRTWDGEAQAEELTVSEIHRIQQSFIDAAARAKKARYFKYYEVVYILFHTGMRISEFCGLTVKDIDFTNHTINIDKQVIRTKDMNIIVQETKTASGKRILPMRADVEECFRSIIRERTARTTRSKEEDGNVIQLEQTVDGYSGFLFLDDAGLPLVAMHWEHRLSHMVNRYNQIYKVQMPKITPHVCRHTYCSNMARKGMNPKTLQYLMGHSDISVTLNVYTHLGLQDAVEEMTRLQDLERAREEQERMDGENSDDGEAGTMVI